MKQNQERKSGGQAAAIRAEARVASFDWDRAIALFHRTLEELYKPPIERNTR
jgi:hypothetical protein